MSSYACAYIRRTRMNRPTNGLLEGHIWLPHYALTSCSSSIKKYENDVFINLLLHRVTWTSVFHPPTERVRDTHRYPLHDGAGNVCTIKRFFFVSSQIRTEATRLRNRDRTRGSFSQATAFGLDWFDRLQTLRSSGRRCGLVVGGNSSSVMERSSAIIFTTTLSWWCHDFFKPRKLNVVNLCINNEKQRDEGKGGVAGKDACTARTIFPAAVTGLQVDGKQPLEV